MNIKLSFWQRVKLFFTGKAEIEVTYKIRGEDLIISLERKSKTAFRNG